MEDKKTTKSTKRGSESVEEQFRATDQWLDRIEVSENGGFIVGKKLVIKSQKYGNESKVISLRMPVDMLEKIDTIATEAGRTRNEILMNCLEFALENVEIK